ncbi:PREDICTED: transmembrane protein 207 [Lipotes vexillifer]|uniref:Transmembrane protein 207 n=1 Tax=Lipotes vexillifer TaxID=118797 RepID=A0A340Y248_LIPVE|nr:PREDICTED: transmembrane protein 207 [Lipotes vexillifer]
MSRSRLLSVTSMVSKTGILCLPLFQLVLSDSPCEENEMLNSSQNSIREMGRRCTNYKDQYTNGWYICLVFIDVDTITRFLWHNSKLRWTEAAVNPTVGMHLQTQNPELYHVSCFGALGPPPPYEKILKSSRF